MVKQMDENVREIGYCSECGETIFDDMEEIFVDSDGHYFDSLDCLIEYFGVTRLEM